MPISIARFDQPESPELGRQRSHREGRHHGRRPTYPLQHQTKKKPRRWPLVLRFVKGAIHGIIIVPVFAHTLFTVLVVCLDLYTGRNFGLPSTIIPSLSIVVGLMLVFRNQTSYNRFWDGRNNLTTILTSIRNLSRTFLTCSYVLDPQTKAPKPLNSAEKADIERVLKLLIAIPYAVKNHLRAEWGAPLVPGASVNAENGMPTFNPEYNDLLPKGVRGYEDQGLGFPLQLTFFVESFIKRGFDRGWFHAPQASQLQVQVNTLMDAYGRMETIRGTPIPVAHLIHQKQVLALFGAVLPFALVDEMGWLTVPVVSLVMFTLYGIEGIGIQLEDPFGYDKNDIKMDAIVDDCRMEVSVMLDEWRRAMRREHAATVTSDGTDTTALVAVDGTNGIEQVDGAGTTRQRRASTREMFIEVPWRRDEGWGYVMR